MSTDFFQQQDHARRGTARLIVLFGVAVVGIIASIEVLLAATMGYVTRDPRTGAVDWTAVTDPQLIFVSVVGTLIVVAGGSLYKMAALRAGGRVVAEQLGGRLLSHGSADLTEQRLLNVVEEMAIASGTPTPPVYLLDQEAGINAFAAGFSPADAVIGVTHGAATRLTRDELQGVIAHEFSHILNGDMRLDIRLMGLLHGILIIGMLGYYILRLSFYAGGGRRSKSDKGGLPILALGAGLAIIGFMGTFFGNLIKAAVSRQREFLADASAVQFTRHPDGLAGALKKIGGFVSGSAVENPNAPEASHMFFSRATSGLNAMFSTHPSLDERIRRLDPAWDGTFLEGAPRTDADVVDHVVEVAREIAGGGAKPGSRAAGIEGFEDAPIQLGLSGVVASIGQTSPAHLDYAARLMVDLPGDLVAAARDPYGARALVYALLLNRQPDARARQLAHLEAAADRGVLDETQRLAPWVDQLMPPMRLPLLEVALPALRTLTASQHRQFEDHVVALVDADKTIDLFEWSLHRILLRSLDAQQPDGHGALTRFRNVLALKPQCELLFSTLAHAGQDEPGAASAAFDRACAVLELSGIAIRPAASGGWDALDAALADLDAASPPVKRQVLQAAVACITADQQVTAAEAELLRAVSASMSCPMPPILPD